MSLVTRKNQLITDIRSLAAEQAKKGVIDRQDVEQLLARAKQANGGAPISKAQATEINAIRVRYADIMTSDACSIVDNFLSNWIQEALQKHKKKISRQKAMNQIERIEDRLEYLRDMRAEKEEVMQELDVDAKQRVLLSQFFGVPTGEDY